MRSLLSCFVAWTIKTAGLLSVHGRGGTTSCNGPIPSQVACQNSHTSRTSCSRYVTFHVPGHGGRSTVAVCGKWQAPLYRLCCQQVLGSQAKAPDAVVWLAIRDPHAVRRQELPGVEIEITVMLSLSPLGTHCLSYLVVFSACRSSAWCVCAQRQPCRPIPADTASSAANASWRRSRWQSPSAASLYAASCAARGSSSCVRRRRSRWRHRRTARKRQQMQASAHRRADPKCQNTPCASFSVARLGRLRSPRPLTLQELRADVAGSIIMDIIIRAARDCQHQLQPNSCNPCLSTLRRPVPSSTGPSSPLCPTPRMRRPRHRLYLHQARLHIRARPFVMQSIAITWT